MASILAIYPDSKAYLEEDPDLDPKIAAAPTVATTAHQQKCAPFSSTCEDCKTNEEYTPEDVSPALYILHKWIDLMCQCAPNRQQREMAASLQFATLQSNALVGKWTSQQLKLPEVRDAATVAKAFPWNSSKVATTLVIFEAATRKQTRDALEFILMPRGGKLTIDDVINTPSVDLEKELISAKMAADDGNVGKVTVLGVHLVDLERLKGEAYDEDEDRYTSFDHSFALGIGREGVRLYQAGAPQELNFFDWMREGKARVRSWKEMSTFINSFRVVCTDMVSPPHL